MENPNLPDSLDLNVEELPFNFYCTKQFSVGSARESTSLSKYVKSSFYFTNHYNPHLHYKPISRVIQDMGKIT